VSEAAEVVDRLFRRESGRAVAALIRVLGDFELAEEAVQEAFAIALERWPADGVPENPGAWITTTARNRAIDRIRREQRRREKTDDVLSTRADVVVTANPGCQMQLSTGIRSRGSNMRACKPASRTGTRRGYGSLQCRSLTRKRYRTAYRTCKTSGRCRWSC